MPPPGYGPPPPQAQPPRPTRVARADRGDRIDHFAAGPHYGPVLKPMLVHRMRVDVHVNPLLLPVGDSDRVHLNWNMLFSTSHCQRSGDPEHRSWSNGRQEPATFPRLTSLKLLCRALPWIIEIKASSPAVGVTCADIIDQLGDYLKTNAPKDDYQKSSSDQQHQLKLNYHHNRSRSDGVPGGRLGEGLRRLDWFGAMSMWGGMDRNDAYVKDRCGVVLPCMFEMFCVPRPPQSEEDREETRRARRRSRSSRRGSSAVNSEESS
ncbi:hypothetical protein DENSPDRAFT_787028 [Dentipellis sp. KUC8613]|nr:hypothetical protein DENSPDRAFT_787028 [Dentipellis sp. KUC8613]